MGLRDFKCKQEEVPVIAGFVCTSLRRDMAQFNDFSTVYNDEFVINLETRRKTCLQMVKSGTITDQMKSVTKTLNEKTQELRPMLNKLEAYLSLADGSLDIATEDFGLKSLRTQISNGNTEAVIDKGNSLITCLNRNEAALVAKGMKADFIPSLTSRINEIDTLNNNQNSKLSDRIQTTSDNYKEFNELWKIVTSVLKTGKLLYRGVDNVKLRDYTLEQLLKRINAAGGNSTTSGESIGEKN